MDSLNKQKAVNSHHSKVVSETQNNKASCNQGVTTSSKGNPTDLKDTNFEYEDNEWDIGIGDLIIDLDADIEKSSSSNLDTSLVIPLQSAANLNAAASVDKKGQAKESAESAETNKTATKTHSKGKSEPTAMASTTNSGNKGVSKMSIDHQATLDKGLKMKIKRTKTGTKTSDSKHEIVKSEQNGNLNNEDAVPLGNCKKQTNVIGVPASPSSSANKRGNNSHRKDKAKDKQPIKEKSEVVPLTQPDTACSCGSEKLGGQPCGSANCVKHRELSQPPRAPTAQSQISLSLEKQSSTGSNTANAPGPPKESLKILSSQVALKQQQRDPQKVVDLSPKSQSNSSTATSSSLSYSSSATNSDEGKMTDSPVVKRIKCVSSHPKSMVDVCVGTSIGTITEPDCLGPCEPGTSVTLEGIVWHETDGGVLAVNVTWRGKTYVGTLIDCTKHDWAPPRFCDSLTEELDSRLPKTGRGKRGRNSMTTTNDLINFTETRSSVHSKLRNGGPKGRASRNSSVSNLNISANATNTVTNTPSTSPTTFSAPRPEKRRRSKDESPSPFNGNSAPTPTTTGTSGNNVPSLNPAVSAASSVKKPKNVTSPCAISPVLLECPEQDCSKKYKHANGLKYHQSHAHGIISNADDDSLTAPDSPSQRSQSPPTTMDTSFSQKLNFESVKANPSDTKNNNHESSNADKTSPATSSAERPSGGEAIDSNSSNPFAEAISKPSLSSSSTPSKQDPPSKNKPNILRNFANTSDMEQTSNDSMSDLQSQSSSFYSLQNKNSHLAKNKKSRKSPGPEDTEICTINKSDGVRSPAYSDISDDSNTATEINLNDKLKVNSDIKKAQESGSNNPLSMGGYNNMNNMYGPFYQPSSFFQPPDNQSTKPPSLPPGAPPGSLDFKSKEHSPLDLMNKLQPSKNSSNEPPGNSSSNPGNPSNPVGKIMQHYQHYPYNFIQPSYPYNMENNYGPSIPSTSEDSKPPQGFHVKEELGKELPSPDALKQGMPQKLIKTEGMKDIKPEPGQSLPSNLSQSPQHLSPYSSLYQRHPIGVPMMTQREEEMQKYFIYPDQRRSSVGGTPTNLSSKDERTSQSPTASHAGAPPSNQHAFKSSKTSSLSTSSSSSKNNSSSKDSKPDEKETKVKQEGQKPTMETQGPPPPPTSQYYLPYMGQGNPFFPDPSHPMYRNMLVPTPPYNSPYHMQMARFSSPEDLSRNPNTKALDLLQQHANQYYNSHKIHELSERVSQMKSPTNNPKIPATSVASPNISQPLPGTNVTSANNISTSLSSNTSSVNNITQSNLSASASSSLSSSQQPPSSKTNDKLDRTDPKDPLSGSNGSLNRSTSPPPQRHVHTHHHTHVGIGYMSGPIGYPAPYVNPAVLAANQQAVINPFTNPPSNK